MAVIGEISIGISAKLDGLEKATKEAKKQMESVKRAAERNMRDLQSFANGVAESVKTPSQKLDDFIKKLSRAKSAGFIDDDQFNSAVAAKRAGLFKTKIDASAASSKSFTTELRQSVRMMKQFLGVFGVISLVSQFASKVGETTQSILALGKESRETGKSIETLTNGALTALDVTKVEAAAAAYDQLAASWDRLAQKGVVKLAPVMRDVLEFLEHDTMEAPTEVQPEIDFFQTGNEDAAKKLESFIADMEKQTGDFGLSEVEKRQKTLAGLTEGLFEGTAAQDRAEKLLMLLEEQEKAAEKLKKTEEDRAKVQSILDKAKEESVRAFKEASPDWAESDDERERRRAMDLGATAEQYQKLIELQEARAQSEAKIGRQAREEEHRVEILEREVAAFEEMQSFADGVTDSLKGPNDKMDEFVEKIEEAKKNNLLTGAQGDAAIAAERKKLFGDQEQRPVAAAFQGSQEAFSAINRFRNGNQEKIPGLQLKEQQKTNRLLEKKIAEPEVAGLN